MEDLREGGGAVAGQYDVVISTLWVLLAAFMVFLMHLGFAMVESGFTQAKNTVNILMKNVVTVTIGVVTYFLVGFGLMFGDSVVGVAGGSYFALHGAHQFTAGVPVMAFWVFQAMFAATCATIVSGAVADIIAVTMMGGATGGLSALLLSNRRTGKADAGTTLNGVLAGLVAVTAGADVLTVWSALLVGAAAGLVLPGAVQFVERVLRVDDAASPATTVPWPEGNQGRLWWPPARPRGRLNDGGSVTETAVSARAAGW